MSALVQAGGSRSSPSHAYTVATPADIQILDYRSTLLRDEQTVVSGGHDTIARPSTQDVRPDASLGSPLDNRGAAFPEEIRHHRSVAPRAPLQRPTLDNRGAAFPEEIRHHRSVAPRAPLQRPTLDLRSASARYKLRDGIAAMLRPEEPGERGPAVCGCGRAGFGVDVVEVKRRESRAVAVSGVYRCGSAWLCPVCAPAETMERQERVRRVAGACLALGGHVVMATITVRHSRKHALADVKKLVQQASREARQGREWQRIAQEGGILGVLCGPEVTWSPSHGWHFHVHVALFARHVDRGAALAAGRAFVARYLLRVRDQGGSASQAGQDVQIAKHPKDAAEYIAKIVSWETAGRSGKTRASGWTPWEISQAALDGSSLMRRLFKEYADAMIGTRSCVVNASLAKKLGIEKEETEERGEQNLDVKGTVVGEVKVDTWNTLMSRRKVPCLIEMVEKDTEWRAIEDWIRESTKPYRIHEPVPEPRAPTIGDLKLHRYRGSHAMKLSAAVQDLRNDMAAPDYGARVRFDLSSAALAPLIGILAEHRPEFVSL